MKWVSPHVKTGVLCKRRILQSSDLIRIIYTRNFSIPLQHNEDSVKTFAPIISLFLFQKVGDIYLVMMDWTLVIAGALSCIVLYRLLVGNRSARLINQIPGPPGYPLIGNLLELLKPNDGKCRIFSNLSNTYSNTQGPIQMGYLGGKIFQDLQTLASSISGRHYLVYFCIFFDAYFRFLW